jgi:hypothetical protein
MSPRHDRPWTVQASYENVDGDRCVDVFIRPDGSFGFEEFRRDPEDMGAWTAIGSFSGRVLSAPSDALAAARGAVTWLGPLLDH